MNFMPEAKSRKESKDDRENQEEHCIIESDCDSSFINAQLNYKNGVLATSKISNNYMMTSGVNLRGTQLTYSPNTLDAATKITVIEYLKQNDAPVKLKIAVIGKHGIGKTRLISNFIKKRRELQKRLNSRSNSNLNFFVPSSVGDSTSN